jgi:acid phosphatase type 7
MLSVVFLCLGFFAVCFAADSSVPEQIALSYGDDPSTMVVTWAVWNTEEAVATCIFGTSADKLNRSVNGTGSTYTIDDYTSPMLYKATISGLEPGNKVYYYSVNSPSGSFSDVFSFKSHPGIGNDDVVTFHVLGDLGQTENSVNTLNEIKQNEGALSWMSGGIVDLGDLSYANGDEPLWDSYGRMKQFLASGLPSMSTPGNHEWFDDEDKLFTAYKARTSNPGSQLYYSYDVGLSHFVMVAGYCTEMKSVETQPCLAEGSPEHNWLVADLAAVNTTVTPWVFVIFHQPYVNSNVHHAMAKEGRPMQEAIETLLYDSGVVDLALCGHVHAYERSCRVYQYECKEDAPYYITIGDGGNKEGLAVPWMEPQPEWSLFRQASYGHGELTVYNRTHALWEWHQNEDLAVTVADSFWIVKGEAAVASELVPAVTRDPVFADSDRGRRGALYEQMVKERMAAEMKE